MPIKYIYIAHLQCLLQINKNLEYRFRFFAALLWCFIGKTMQADIDNSSFQQQCNRTMKNTISSIKCMVMMLCVSTPIIYIYLMPFIQMILRPHNRRSARNRAYEWIIITNNNKNTEYPIYSLPVHFSFIFFAARLNKIGLEQSWCVNIE